MLRRSRLVPLFESWDSCEPVLDMDVGGSEKGLPTCVSVVVRYVSLKSTGMKLTVLVK